METKAKSTKKSAKVEQKAEVVKKVTMAKFVDTLLLTGGKLEDIVAKAKAEADVRKVPTLSTTQLIKAHIRFRINRNELPIKFEDGVVTVVTA